MKLTPVMRKYETYLLCGVWDDHYDHIPRIHFWAAIELLGNGFEHKERCALEEQLWAVREGLAD